MPGCFGNDPYDRYLEGQLNEYLAATEDLTEEEAEERQDKQDRLDAMREEALDALRDDERNTRL